MTYINIFIFLSSLDLQMINQVRAERAKIFFKMKIKMIEIVESAVFFTNFMERIILVDKVKKDG